MSQLFAPTTLRITFETEGLGKFASEEIEEVAVRDASGTVVELRLPKKMVIIANHQVGHETPVAQNSIGSNTSRYTWIGCICGV